MFGQAPRARRSCCCRRPPLHVRRPGRAGRGGGAGAGNVGDHRAMKLEGRVAVVTGAGRNIGEAVAQLFAAQGAKVAVVDLDRPRGERTAAAINGAGGTAAAFVTDVSKASEVKALVAAVVERFGR